MRKEVLIIIIAILVVTSIVSFLIFGFDGGGFGRGHGAYSGNVRSLSIVLFVVPIVLAVSIAGYIVVFPSIEKQKQEAHLGRVSKAEDKDSALDAVLRVSDENERKVIEILASAENKTMLQKDIRWNTHLSRVKTHRVLYRLAKRRIITIEKYYNTNKVTLAEWLAERK